VIIALADKDRETIRRKLIAAGHLPTAALMANIKRLINSLKLGGVRENEKLSVKGLVKDLESNAEMLKAEKGKADV
jgi:hypothetical protein